MKYVDGRAQEAGRPQGEQALGAPRFRAFPRELRARSLGVGEKTAKSGALGNTHVLEMCFLAAKSVPPSPRSTPSPSKGKLQPKNPFPLSPRVSSLPAAGAEQSPQPSWQAAASPSWRPREALWPGRPLGALHTGILLLSRGGPSAGRGQNTQWRSVHQIGAGIKEEPGVCEVLSSSLMKGDT